MDPVDPKPDYTGVVDSVMQLFGEVMSREAVCAIVEHYDGDLNQSIDAIMIMSDDQVPASASKQTPSTPTIQLAIVASTANQQVPNTSTVNIATNLTKQPVSYAGVSQSRGALPKQPQIPKQSINNNSPWALQVKQIIDYHNEGSRTLILLRGVPGSGKSYLAKQLLQTMIPGAVFRTHILSTDNYFEVRGQYNYDKNRLSDAHLWNQNRATEAMRRGLSPIFIDNTNIEIWEMEPYARSGINHGYIIEVLEPNTPWARKAFQLANKNTHNVPIAKIKRMLDNYRNDVSGLYLMRYFKLSYSPKMAPPVLRNVPPFLPSITLHQEQPSVSTSFSQANDVVSSPIKSITSTTETNITQPETTIIVTPASPTNSEHLDLDSAGTETVSNDDTESATTKSHPKQIRIEELKKQIEDIEKLELEWENGENWNDEEEENARGYSQDRLTYTPQPPRTTKVEKVDKGKFLPSTSAYNNWSDISMFMPAWNDDQHKNPEASANIKVETATKETSVEFGEINSNNKNLKILIGTPKDINFYYMGLNEEKIPQKRMLDKSSMTNDHDQIATEVSRCKNEEKHFAAFRKLFKNVSKIELRDIFDKCVGDVNWAVDIVLDGMENRQLQTIDPTDISDSEDFGDDQCECLAAYNIIPSVNTQQIATTSNAQHLNQTRQPEAVAGPSTPKNKKEKVILESSIQLKRQIEKNVVISESHYSDHCLKIRKIRRGETSDRSGESPEEESEQSFAATPPNAAGTMSEAAASETDEETSSIDDCERSVNVDLGSVFIGELDGMFGRHDMQYPENVETRVNMPVSLLNEINALWMESLMYQLDQQSRQSELMVRQDEEFARQLALKEEQFARTGKEPAIPDLKEIMDLELALSIYKKEITAEWRSNEPNDLAARMTRDKLYNLFPDVQPAILSELLMAHDNNFQATVEVLLSSTGNAQVLEDQNGVTKFIAKKELERQEKILEEQKKALSEVEWPLLPKDMKADMITVQKYRAKASEHLAQRNLYYEKAQDFFRRDMTQVATYYSDVAVLHKKRFDQANSLAAASLMQVHAANCTDNATIDLHFLHVAEAKETLDLFIDTHIKKLRDSLVRGGPKYHNLFFITGRGLHSRGGPRVKPAVKRRLRERGIAFAERNPGLLTSKVCGDDKMTFELP